MPNIVIPNTVLNASGEKFHAIWKLTRGLLAAGWKYKASSDGVTKEAGTGDSSKDMWSVSGYINLSTVPAQTGTAASLLTYTNGFVTVQGLTGMTANSVGRVLTISGDTDATDNGSFRIATFISASSVTIYNPNFFTLAVTTTTGNGVSPIVVTTSSTVGMTSGQQVGISGVNGNTAANGIWTITVVNSTQFSLNGSTGNGAYTSGGIIGTDAANGAITWKEQYGGAAASVTTVLNGIATLTGLTGMTTASVGHRITISGAASAGNNGTFIIASFISATSVTIQNASAVAGDANNGLINWTERDPAQDLYPASISAASGTGAWLNLQGPSTLKIPIGSTVPNPAFLKGEKITQSATGAEGEIIGVVTDSSNAGGFLVIAPRVQGSGAGGRGWDTSIITASAVPTGSGASVTPSGTAVEYIREIVWWKDTATTGHIYYQCIDPVSEGVTAAATGRFSTLASLGTATAVVAPGGATGNPTVNGFPITGTLAIVGTGGSGAHGTGSTDWFSISSSPSGLIQVICANNIEVTGSSADGSWTVAIGSSTVGNNLFVGNCFMRLDDIEDGDVDPYVLGYPANATAYNRSRTGGTTALTTNDAFAANVYVQGTNTTAFVGFRRRGFAVGDVFQEFGGFALNTANSSNSASSGGGQTNSFGFPDAVACTFVSPAPRVREPIWIMSVSLNTGQTSIQGTKMRKGTLRWWYLVQGGQGTDTLDGKRWIQLGGGNTIATNSPIVVGPWDQTTVPLNG